MATDHHVSPLLSCFWILVFHMAMILGAGQLELVITSLQNPEGRLRTGAPCGAASAGNTSVQLPGLCRTAVFICLDRYMDPPLEPALVDASECVFGTWTSDGIVAVNSITQEPDHVHSRFGFTYAWPGKITIVIDFYHLEERTDKQHLVFRSVKPLQIQATVGDKWTVVEDGTNSSDFLIHLQYSVRVLCGDTFHGPQCSKECEPRDNEFGHYNCSADGTKVCLSGWSGLACMKVGLCDGPVEFDRCAHTMTSASCATSGERRKGDTGARRIQPITAICRKGCKGSCQKPFGCDNCVYGWTGPNCDVCQTSATCVHGYCNKPHQCICYNKWGGKDCDKDEDFCLHRKPCLNGGTCHNLNNDFKCHCAPGFTGRVCDIRNCHHLCRNGGKCIHFRNGSSECLCPAKYIGQFCESRIDLTNQERSVCHYHGQRYQNGSLWKTDKCSRCICIDGHVDCTSAKCNVQNCLQRRTEPKNFMSCPNDQLCTAVNAPQWSCARGPCHQVPFGQCLPIRIVENPGDDRRQFCDQPPHSAASVGDPMCLRFYAVLDDNLIPPGTFASHICFNMLMVFVGNNINGLNLFCDVISRNGSHTTIIIDMVSLGDDLSLTSMQNHLISSLLNRATPFALLQAVTAIQKMQVQLTNDEDAQVSAQHVDSNGKELKNRSIQEFLSIALPLIVGCMLALTLLTFVILRKMRRFWSLLNQPTFLGRCACDKASNVVDQQKNNYSTSTIYYDELDWSLESTDDGGHLKNEKLTTTKHQANHYPGSVAKYGPQPSRLSDYHRNFPSKNFFVPSPKAAGKNVNSNCDGCKGDGAKLPFVTFTEKTAVPTSATQQKRTIIEFEVNV